MADTGPIFSTLPTSSSSTLEKIPVRSACRENLIVLMPSPTVVTDLTGGHLALMVRLEQYADLVTKFILERTP